MPHIVTTAAANVSLPYQPSLVSGLNSRTIVASGTTVVLNDFEYAALSSTAISGGTLIDGGDVNASGTIGTKVERATAALPTTATGSLFTIATGRILLTSLLGEVTTVIQNQACTLTVIYNPTDTGADQTLAIASASIAADAVGTIYSLSGVVAEDLEDSLNWALIAGPRSLVLKPGAIQLTTSATNTGSVKWTATYLALDSGATLVAA